MCLRHGRGQIALCGFCLAEVMSRSGASAWPRSGRALWLLRGRGQVVLCGFCVAEVMSRSGASAWPRSSRALWGLLGRGQVFVRGFSSFFCAVHGIFGEPWSYKFEAECFARLRSEWSLFFFCYPVQFFFFQLSTAEVASLSVERLAHLIVAAVSFAADSIDMFLGDGVCSSSLVMLFLARLLCSVFGCPFRVVLRLIDYFSVLIGVTSGVSIDLSSAVSVFEVLVSARVLLARFTLVVFRVLSLSWLFGS